MNKIEIEVPINVRYISEWNDFDITLLQGHSIINKTITGCGFTHYSLTNNIPTILCSPRKFLLENKFKQIKGLCLVVNKGEKSLDIDGESKSSGIKEKKENFEEVNNIINQVSNYCLECQMSNKTPKILVTYDSLKHVLSALGEYNISNYSIIVDEFQNIFMDSKFKADTELNFLAYLQDCPNVTYLSATPYIEEYLNELDEFKNLLYYELKWDPNRLRKIDIDFKKTTNISRELDRIIDEYKSGKYPIKFINSNCHEAREVVFYVNSVKMIISTIKRNNLTVDQVNIICSDTEKNRKDLKKIGFEVGTAPLEGQPHKMFTFCTRTTYVGADFYSTCAWSVIVSDCKIDSLATDIRMDFPQIMGRQRLKENVFRDECIFIYKLADSEITFEEFDRMFKRKLKESEIDLKNYRAILLSGGSEAANKLIRDFRLRISAKKYNEDYTGICEKTGEPTLNKLVMLAEKRAFELRSNIYKNDVLVYNEFEGISSEKISSELFQELQLELEKLSTILVSQGSFSFKMESICNIFLNPKYNGHIGVSDIKYLPRSYRNYLNYPGPERIKALGYKEADILREISNYQSSDLVKLEFIKKFKVGIRYTLRDIKFLISSVYNHLGILKTPKATDILEYFEVRECLVTDKETKKRSKGYEILKIKE